MVAALLPAVRADDGPLRVPADTAPAALRALGTLEGLRALAVTEDGAVAAVALDAAPERKKRQTLLRIAGGAAPREAQIEGTVRALRFGPSGEALYAILAHESPKRGTAEVFVVRLDPATLRTTRTLRMPLTAKGMDLSADGTFLLVACRNELRVVLVPELRSPRLFGVQGDNLAVGVLAGSDRILVGQKNAIVIVDLSDRQSREGLLAQGAARARAAGGRDRRGPGRTRRSRAARGRPDAPGPRRAASSGRRRRLRGSGVDRRTSPLRAFRRAPSERRCAGRRCATGHAASPIPRLAASRTRGRERSGERGHRPAQVGTADAVGSRGQARASPERAPDRGGGPEYRRAGRHGPHLGSGRRGGPGCGALRARQRAARGRARDSRIRRLVVGGSSAPGSYRIVLDAGGNRSVVSDPPFARVVLDGRPVQAPELTVLRVMRP